MQSIDEYASNEFSWQRSFSEGWRKLVELKYMGVAAIKTSFTI